MTDDGARDPARRHEAGLDRPADPEGGVPEPVHEPAPHAGEPAGRPVPEPEREGADRGESHRAEERAATAAEAPQGGASPLVLALSALLPGAGHLVIGSPLRGMAFLISWGVLLAALWLGWDVLAAINDIGSTDDWVAVATLALGMLAVWLGAFRDLRGAVRADAEDVARRAASGEYRADRAADRAGDSQWAIAARHFRRNRLALIGMVVVVGLYLVALLAPLLAPYDPIAQGDLVASGYLSPNAEHWLGTDQFGRDILSRILFGARISLAIGFIAVAIAIVLGSLLGAIAGYLGGAIDAVIMRFTDMVMAFPRLVLLIMIIALFEPSITLIILVLGLTQWPGTARLVRGEVLSLREQEYVQAARALGFGRSRIILRHLIPNVLAPVIVAATLGIGNTIVLEAGLSFLGMGVQPPTPSWGTLVADGRQNLLGAWWVATFPGLAIVVTVLAFNLVGDGLRDALDPRLRS